MPFTWRATFDYSVSANAVMSVVHGRATQRVRAGNLCAASSNACCSRLRAAQSDRVDLNPFLADIVVQRFYTGRITTLDLVVLIRDPGSDSVVWESIPTHHQWPGGSVWQINGAQAEELTATAVDAIGNGLEILRERDGVPR